MLIRVGSLMLAVPAVLLLVLYGIDMSHISDCSALDQVYDPDSGTCVVSENATPTYYTRHPLLVNLFLLVSVIGTLVMCWGMLIKGPSSREH